MNPLYLVLSLLGTAAQCTTAADPENTPPSLPDSRQSCIEPNPGVSGFTTRYHRALRPPSSMRHWKVAGALNKPNKV